MVSLTSIFIDCSSPPCPQPSLACCHPNCPAIWETILLFSLRFFTFPRSFTVPLGMGIAFLSQQKQWEMRGIWIWEPSLPLYQLLFWWDTDFFLALPVGRKLKKLKFTKLLLVNTDIVSAFYSDSSKAGFNFLLMQGPRLDFQPTAFLQRSGHSCSYVQKHIQETIA